VTPASAWATRVETSAEALAPPELVVTPASALAAWVDVSTDAWAPADASADALAYALATGVEVSADA
jgi:hypothetical protein